MSRFRACASALFLTCFAFLAPSAVAQNYAFEAWAGKVTTRGSVDAAGAEARFNNANGLSVDLAGNIYVADGLCVRKISPAGLVTTLAGSPTSVGLSDGIGPAARFQSARRTAVDRAGNVYVADQAEFGHRIRKITPAGVVTTLAGPVALPGRGPGGDDIRFYFTTGLALDAADNLYVGTTSVIYRITPEGGVSVFAGLPNVSAVVDGPRATGTFSSLLELSCDTAGVISVVDTQCLIRKITPDGTISTLAGVAGEGGIADGTGAAARFDRASCLTLAPDGALFLIDSGLLRRVSPEGVVTTVAGAIGYTTVPVDGAGSNARFYGESSLACNAAGELFLSEAGTSVRRGRLTTVPSPPIISTMMPYYEQFREVGARTSLALTITAAGTPLPALQWSKDGLIIPGATTSTFTVASVSASDEGTYTLTATNVAGSVKASISVRVYTPALSNFISRRSNPDGSFLWAIASGAGQLVTVGTGGKILTSVNGGTWTTRNSGTAEWLVGIVYAAGKFVVVGDHGTILVSTDAITWTAARQSGTTQRLNNVTYGQGLFVAVGEGGTIVTSTDAQAWTPRVSGVTTWLRGVIYQPEYLVSSNKRYEYFWATGQGGTFLSSPDGVKWTAEPHGKKDVEAIARNPFPLTIGQDGDLWYASPRFSSPSAGAIGVSKDPNEYTVQFLGWSWAPRRTGLGGRFRGLGFGVGVYFATGENGTIAAASSAFGPWAIIPAPTTANLVGGVLHNDAFYVVGENETILQSDNLFSGRLVNLSTRGAVSSTQGLISGLVITGDQPKSVLLRAVGPALTGFGLPGALAAPNLTLFDPAGKSVATNIRWGTAANAGAIAEATTRVGAFPFADGSADSALLVTLAPGAYTAQISGIGGAAGHSLIEAYDADAISNTGSRAINISTRGLVGGGTDRLIAGFVLNGSSSRRILIRAAGPALADYGLTDLLAAPQIQLIHASGYIVQSAGAWSTSNNAADLRAAAVIAGAFPFAEGSTDAALIATLLPGSYTVQVSGLGPATGLALVEVYDLP